MEDLEMQGEVKTITMECADCGQEHTFWAATADGHRCAACGSGLLKIIGKNIRTREDVQATKKLYKQSKPPLGIMPRRIHDSIRARELVNAIERYIDACKEIPIEWVEEYNELTEYLKNRPHP
jgi:ribosomal protein S27E